MTSNMWNLSLGDDALGNLTPPDEIVAIQCKYLENITEGNILARISQYRNQHTHDIVDDGFMFEFFLTSKYAPNYKYTVMFIKHSIDYYPLTIQLDSDIADEICTGGQFSNPNLTVNDENEFIHALSKIINSAKMRKVINSLYSMVKSHERKNDAFFGKEE